MIDFSQVKSVTIPEGNVVRIEGPNGLIWSSTATLTIHAHEAINLGNSKANIKYTINGIEYTPAEYGGDPLVLTVPKGTLVRCELYSDDYTCTYGESKCIIKVNDTIVGEQHSTLIFSYLVSEDTEIFTSRIGRDCYLHDGRYYNIWLYIRGADVELDTSIQDQYAGVYVSFGDSIAAGHSLDYFGSGTSSQYGVNGNTSTYIIEDTYTDLIRAHMSSVYDDQQIKAISYARSGDRVDDLVNKLDDPTIINSVKEATHVTICIGANDILTPALESFHDYVIRGQQALDDLSVTVSSALTKLNTDSDPYSYKTLFDKLNSINPNAQYIFTTVYNPYKYLWLEDGVNGFFKPLLDLIPDMNILWFDVSSLIRAGLLNTSAVRTLFDRTNAIGAWAETHINRLNDILRTKIEEYKSTNSNFYLAETKALFDTYPDRTPNNSADTEYNDLVNVEFTRNYDMSDVDWGALKGSKSWWKYWFGLASDHTSWSGFDIEGFAEDLVSDVINKVILPDIDPHPERGGHRVLKDAFTACYEQTL